jgi:hypothetical protein
MRHSPQFMPCLLTFLERFGARFGFSDPECQTLEITVRDIGRDELEAALREYSDAIRTRLYHQHRRRMSIYRGGPLEGQPHGGPRGYPFRVGERYFYVLPVKLGRARWAAYRLDSGDDRAWFVGMATSWKKARQLAVNSVTEAAP